MTARSITLILIVTSAFGIACESKSATQPVLDPAVLTTLEVVPRTVTPNYGEERASAQLGIVAPRYNLNPRWEKTEPMLPASSDAYLRMSQSTAFSRGWK